MEKRIHVQEMYDACHCINLYTECLKEEEAHKARCKSPRTIAVADRKIAQYNERIERETYRHNQFVQEAKEARELATKPGVKIYFMYQPLDSDGRNAGDPIFTQTATIKEAFHLLRKTWDGLRGYGTKYSVVVRDDGLVEERQRIEAEIERLQLQLKAIKEQMGE